MNFKIDIYIPSVSGIDKVVSPTTIFFIKLHKQESVFSFWKKTFQKSENK